MLRKFIEAIVGAIAAVILVFFIIHLVPGDPAQIMLGEKATPQAIEKARKDLGLDRPLHEQLAAFLGRLAQGDMGKSIRSGRPVFEEIKSRLPATVELSFIAMVIAITLGICLGALAAIKPGGVFDFGLMSLSVLGLSLPIFFLGLLLILIFGSWLEWTPLSGRLDYSVMYTPITGFILLDALLQLDFHLFWVGFLHLILPSIALATIPLSMIARLTRSSLIEVMRADYIRTAVAKGASPLRLFFKHALRNGLLPVITMAGFQFGMLLGGAILTENVFAWPGMGRWIVSSVEGRDFPAVQGAILCFVLLIIVVMMITDAIHRLIDPRLRMH